MSEVVLSPQEQLTLQMLEDLNAPHKDGHLVNLTTRLHPKQIECLMSLYVENKKLIFVPCGRKFGKSELAGYVCWKQAISVPDSAIYYVAPEASHGRKIMWDTQRLQRFLGTNSTKYINKINNLEMKVMFKNRSFIQIIGSENWAAANGLTPALVVYDEFKIFHPQFHIEMDPNRAAKAAPLVIIGTQPKVGDRNKGQYEALLEYGLHSKNTAAVHVYTTFDNPINLIPERKQAIEEQIKVLRMRGEEDVVQREYYSKIVPGGSRAVFPMLDDRHVQPHEDVVASISKDIQKLEWYCITDPGTTTCFAGLIAAINPYTKKVYILDEIYEKDQLKTSVSSIYPRLRELMQRYYPGSNIDDDWTKGYDEAAAWYANEVMQQYGVYFVPTDKTNNKKEAGLSLIKDQLLHDLVVVSDKCKFLFKEMQEYAKDDRGNIPKKNDHLIDCYRYLNSFAHYSMLEVMELIRRKNDSEAISRGRYRGFDDLDQENEMESVIDSIFCDF